MRGYKYKAMLEDNIIFINFLDAIFNNDYCYNYNYNVKNAGKNKRIKRLLTKEVLEYYLNCNKSVNEIAKHFKVSGNTIYSYMDKYNLEINKTLPSKEYLINNMDRSYLDIAITFKVSKSTIQRLYKVYGIKKEVSIEKKRLLLQR